MGFDPDDFLAKAAAAGDALLGRKPRDRKTPLPVIRGRTINNVFYVRADDVADALEAQAPITNRRLIDRLRKR